MTAIRLQGLPPIIGASTRILILGSFPSDASLSAGRYYAHPRNQFWRILTELLACPFQSMSYGKAQAEVLRAGLGIWDVYALCCRQGSLDSAIRAAEPNNFLELKKLAPNLERVCFNGAVAGKFSCRLAALGYEVLQLPSTSPAYTLSFEHKLALWRDALALPMPRKISTSRSGAFNTG